jgi:aspartyl-tRNA(Asn)/glutamyl-tRNA(Gln) amidotransferase subunit A
VSETGSLQLSVAELASGVREGKVSPRTVIDASFDRACSVGAGADGLNIILAASETAASDADEVTKQVDRGGFEGRLAGVPIAIKDNIATLNMPTTCGSRILEGYLSPFEATAVTRLRAEGALVVAKTNMDEFAMGSSTENSAYGPARNPVDVTRVPGGSSGGSAAAVAAGITPVALGSETGGSVRQPASFCGVVGVKPTYGRVSRFGLVAFGSSLDQIGVFGRRVDDAARVLEVIAGADTNDSTARDVQVDAYYASSDLERLDGLIVGRPKEYFPDSLDSGIRSLCDRVFDRLRDLGAEIRDVSLPNTALAIPVYYIVAPAEASSNLARYDGIRYGLRVPSDRGLAALYEDTRSRGFGPEVTRRILLGTYVLSAGYYDAYYKKAQQVRTLIAEDFRSVFNAGVHLLFTPTAPTTAFKLGSISDPYEMYLSDIFTATANLAGVPAMSLPIGRSGGLPVGGQFIANHFEEARMFGAAYALERALGDEAHR